MNHDLNAWAYTAAALTRTYWRARSSLIILHASLAVPVYFYTANNLHFNSLVTHSKSSNTETD